MAKLRSNEGTGDNHPKKDLKRKWSREDHGEDQEFSDKPLTPKKRSASTSDVFNTESTPLKIHGQTFNTPNTEVVTPKRRGRKPGTKMPPKTKEKDKVDCDCFTPHESSYRCQLEAKFGEYCNISTKIISTSQMITVFVGEGKETFAVHKDLLKLHSGLIREYLADDGGEDDSSRDDMGKLSLPTVKPTMFADFVSWMYNGNYLQDAKEAKKEEEDVCTQLWTMGAFLKAPGFQNFCMDDYQTWCKQNSQSWPSVAGIELIYKLAAKGSLFRRFAAHSVHCKPPFEGCKEGSKEHKEWSDFLDRCPELVMDMALMGKSWNGTVAWDDANRLDYMVEEVALDERWEDLILTARSKENVAKAAANGCRRSRIELAHLNRHMVEDDTTKITQGEPVGN
ncbi:hypothetical protein N431DRAFT_355108 [Stipitochalara longipes BDJ]|nr:hypothetical protein N431DRAFT_355108 [Stipitochalara longipes BDJ]